MPDSSVAITAGTGTNVQTFTNAAGNREQYTRERRITACTLNEWTIATTAATSQIAADITRIGMLMVNGGSGRVYLRFDSTAPTAAAYHWYLEPGDRWEVPDMWVQLVVSMLGTVAGGEIYSTLGTAA